MNPIKSLAQRILKPELTAINNSLRGIAGRSLVQEATLADLQRELRGWDMLGNHRDAFSRDDIDTIIRHSRTVCIKNPFGQRWLNLMTYYTFAQGCTLTTDDGKPQEELDKITDERANARQLFGHMGREYANRELCATGNLFVLRIPDARPVPQVRVLPVEQFREVVTDPEDAESRWFYLRQARRVDPATGSDSSIRQWHPDGGMTDEQIRALKGLYPDKFRDLPIIWDRPVSHYSIGGFANWQWGIPPAYAALSWMASHTKFLTDVSTVMSALSRFATKITGTGYTQEQVTAAQSLLQSSWVASVDNEETNPPTVAGSTWISNDGVKLDPFQARGMHLDPDDGNNFALMVFAALGIPAHMFGDVDQGNLATATSLDRPTELLFRHHQELHGEIQTQEAEWALNIQRRTGAVGVKPDGLKVRADFPPILHHDPQTIMQALVTGLTLNGLPLAPMFQGAERETAREILATADIDAGTIDAMLELIYDDNGNMRNPPVAAPVVTFPESRPRGAQLLRSVQSLVAAVNQTVRRAG